MHYISQTPREPNFATHMPLFLSFSLSRPQLHEYNIYSMLLLLLLLQSPEFTSITQRVLYNVNHLRYVRLHLDIPEYNNFTFKQQRYRA